jgi:hypothetical protein
VLYSPPRSTPARRPCGTPLVFTLRAAIRPRRERVDPAPPDPAVCPAGTNFRFRFPDSGYRLTACGKAGLCPRRSRWPAPSRG